jgi:sortase A
MRWLAKVERLLLVFGLLMLGVYLGARAHKAVLSRAAVESFKTELPAERPGTAELVAAKPDFSLWSEKRVKEYQDSLLTHFAPAIGILRIPKIGVEVPVLEGTDDLSLNRGVGRIEGTATLGESGNIGIAGHRDGFFRGLKDVGPGDRIELVTPKQTDTFVIDQISIVDPDDVSVLAPRTRPSLTLVTCYPFYFVGSAPKRYIVQASITDSGPAKSPVMQ